MGGFAWVTLATNDSYSLGALVLAHSLKQVGTTHPLVVLITPGVSNAMREKLSTVFNVVQEVNILDSKDEANLRLLKRPELGITFTKLHCWRLTQFEKCVFLDADTLVLQNCDELFEREELSAAPDVGWPDCFNSGVFVYHPSNETYENLVQFALEKGSFDGGDQGLLNLYFSDWATKDISKHLPFIYNLSSTATYSYLPAFKQFGADAKIIHFIGPSKPWLQYFNTETRRVQPSPDVKHLEGVLQQWWNIFWALIHPNLSPEMPKNDRCHNCKESGLAGAFAQLTLGAARTPEQSALDDHLRRQGWEVGNIDYMGRDSFDNIWSKICETLSSGLPTQTPPISDTAAASPSESSLPVETEASNKISPEQEVAKPVSEQLQSLEKSEIVSAAESLLSADTMCQLQRPIESLQQIPMDQSEAPASATEPPIQEALSTDTQPLPAKVQTETSQPTEVSPSVVQQVPPAENIQLSQPESTEQITSSEASAQTSPTEVASEPVAQTQASSILEDKLSAPVIETPSKLPEQSETEAPSKLPEPSETVSESQQESSSIAVDKTSTAAPPEPITSVVPPEPPSSAVSSEQLTPVVPSEPPSSVTPSEPPSSVTSSEQPSSVTPSELQSSGTPSEPTSSAAPSETPSPVKPSEPLGSVPPSKPPSSASPSEPLSATAQKISEPTSQTQASPQPTPSTEPAAPSSISETSPTPQAPSTPQPSTKTSVTPSEAPPSPSPVSKAAARTTKTSSKSETLATTEPSVTSSQTVLPSQPTTEAPSTEQPPAEVSPPVAQPAKAESASAMSTESSKKSPDVKPEITAAASVGSPTPPPRKTGGGKKSKSKK